jgi:hypothetical protein
VGKNVQISYRGARYELGQGPQFYGIWAADAAKAQPLEWWPKTPAGWSGAWARFVTIETPGTIGPLGHQAVPAHGDVPRGQPTVGDLPAGQAPAGDVPAADAPATVIGPSYATPTGKAFAAFQPLGPARTRLAGGLLAAGIGIGVAGLFPSYLTGSSLASQDYLLVPHIVYLIAWATAAVLIALGGSRQRIGALLAVGTSLVTFGLFFADAGEVMGHLATAGPGLALGLVGWLACAAGSALAFEVTRTDGPGRPDRRELISVVTLMAAGLGAAIAFAPAWDSYLLRWDFGSTTRTLGNAFSNPAAVIVGNVAVMAAVVVVVAAAAVWRPVRHGGVLVIGAAIPLAAQAISALLQLRVPTPAGYFGIPQSEVGQYGLTITNGLTPMFWVFCGFVVTLALLAARMLIADDLIVTGRYGSSHPGAAGGWSPATAPLGGAGSGAVALQAPSAAMSGVPGAASWPFFAPEHAQAASGHLPGTGYSPTGMQPPPSGGPAPDVRPAASGETAQDASSPAPDGDGPGHAEPPAAT